MTPKKKKKREVKRDRGGNAEVGMYVTWSGSRGPKENAQGRVWVLKSIVP